MVSDILKDTAEKMEKSVIALQKDLATLRAGRATPALLDKLVVDYYGVPTPIAQMASISVPEPRLLVVQPWDKSTVKDVEKAILKSDLGLTPISDGVVIRLPIPAMTEERRVELTKTVRRKGEDCKILVRNARREANDLLKELERVSDISEDEQKRAQEDVQKLTDKYIEQIDAAVSSKETEIMTI